MDTTFAFSPSTWVRDVQTEDGAALLDIRQGVCFGMNPVGAEIWNMLKRHCSADFIAECIAAKFSVPKEQAQIDVNDFIHELIANELAAAPGQQRKRPQKNRILALLRQFVT
jgi:hypothetical protein